MKQEQGHFCLKAACEEISQHFYGLLLADRMANLIYELVIVEIHWRGTQNHRNVVDSTAANLTNNKSHLSLY